MDRQQFIQEVKGSQPALRRLLTALCSGNRAEADDIAQDTLVKAYLSLSKYEERGKGTAWLYRIAYHTFIDWGRSHRPLQPLEVLADRTDNTFAADRDFRYQTLYMALEKLPPKERSAILLL